MKLRERAARRQGGFTLMELLVVVAILVVLAGAAVPIYLNYLEGAKRSMAWTNAKTLERVCDLYRIKHGDYPPSLHELANPTDGSKPDIELNALNDPWGHEYQYNPTGQHSRTGKPDIWATDPAKQDQIGNWLDKPPT
jgi:general secretion pathway protein G